MENKDVIAKPQTQVDRISERELQITRRVNERRESCSKPGPNRN